MSLIEDLKEILRREELFVEDKFDEWVSVAKTTSQTLDHWPRVSQQAHT